MEKLYNIEGARENNLKNLTVQIPFETLTVVTGVSGSGKSTLIRQILYPALKKQLEELLLELESMITFLEILS